MSKATKDLAPLNKAASPTPIESPGPNSATVFGTPVNPFLFNLYR